jgi:nitrogen fixation NifU-like protein
MFEDVKMPEGMNPEVLQHLMSPSNYGKLENHTGVGVAMDEKSGEYVIFYLHVENNLIKDTKFATNGCQDTLVIGSMYTEMIMNNDLPYAEKAILKMQDKLGVMSPQQVVCSEIVFNSFKAALINDENRKNGIDEEMHSIQMEDSCLVEDGENSE